MTTSPYPTVLIIDDNRHFVDMVSGWLSEEYNVLEAYSGTQALAAVDDSVDVILLDRRMPGISGDETLERLRECGTDVIISFMTSVEPDTDVVDLPVEGYILKPVSPLELQEQVAELVRQRSYHRTVRQLYSVAEKRAALETAHNREVLSMDGNYRSLRAKEEQLIEQLGGITDQFSDRDFIRSFQISCSGGL